MSFGGLYISISGIHANKRALDTISHNITNANNRNYVRQSVIHAEGSYVQNVLKGYQLGTGVTVQQIRQIRDEFLDLRIRNEMASYGYFNAKSEILGEIEAVFNEITSSGLQSVMDDFWNGWSELYKEPESLTIRGLLHESAVALTTTINHINQQLDNYQHNLNKEMLNTVQEVNGLLRDIASLNKEIKLNESFQGVTANDYRDSLNAKLDRLSEILPIKYYENQYGELVVSVNGRNLINGDYFNPIEIRLNNKGHGEIYWSDTKEKIDLMGRGELAGLIEARDELVTEYKHRLNILVTTIGEAVNTIHRAGRSLDYGLPGASEPTTGIDFFQYDPANPAATIKVNPLLADFDKISVSLTGAKGDGEIARAILSLRDMKLFGEYEEYFEDLDGERKTLYIHGDLKNILENIGGQLPLPGDVTVEDLKSIILDPLESLKLPLTSDEFYRDLILSLSLKREEAASNAESQTVLINQMDQRRQEISAVSLDEEMANMLTYQHSYIANSRVINTIDQMMDIMINRMGVVGR